MSAACGGGNNGSAAAPDAGMSSSQLDAGQSNGKPPSIPRRDAQVADTPDPITPCNRNDANACASGEVCDLLIRRAAGETKFGFYTGCVTETRERAEGDPCDADLTNNDRYMAPGLKDEVYRDPCGPGLVCSPNRDVRGAYSCQPVCATGKLGDAPFACKEATALCVRGTQISEYCRKPDGCDVEKQTGCHSGEGCYLIPSDDGKQLVSVCASKPKTATADGSPSCTPVSCNPGSVCLGPVHMPISAWDDSNVMCRRVCNGEMGTAPASDEDAGVPVGLCSATTRCEAYSASGLLLSSIPAPPFGQCESQ